MASNGKANGRWAGITRPYSTQDVERLRGSIQVEYTIARLGAGRLWKLLHGDSHVAALGGAEVYKALGAGNNISYNSNVQSGTHCSVRPEWTATLKAYIEVFLKNTGTATSVMNPAPNYTGQLSDWATWTTPTLQ